MEPILTLILIFGGGYVGMKALKYGAILIGRHNLNKDPVMRRIYAKDPELRRIYKLKEEPEPPPKPTPPEPPRSDTRLAGLWYPLHESWAKALYVLGYQKGINRATDNRNKDYKFVEWGHTIGHSDLRKHLYVVGKTGIGKTKFLELIMRQMIDTPRRYGFGVIDPHGDLTEEIKAYLTCKVIDVWKDEKKLNDELLNLLYQVVIVDPTRDPSVRFNPLELPPGVPADRVAGELKAVFKKIWGDDSWGPRLENLLLNSFVALAETGRTLADLPKFLIDADFRSDILAKMKNENALTRLKEYHESSEAGQRQWREPVLNKVDAMLGDSRMRRLFSSKESTFNLRDIMDRQKILLVKLSRGELGDNTDLLGSLFLAKIQLTAFSRINMPENKRPPWTLFIDEFQNFATETFNVILSEARKFGLELVLAHQNLAQLPEKVQASILGNCGLHVYFRTSHQDAQVLAREGLNVAYKDPELAGDDYEPYKISYIEPKDRAAQIERLEKQHFIFRDTDEHEAFKLEAPDILTRADIIRKNEALKTLADDLLGAGYYKYEDAEKKETATAPGEPAGESEEETFWEKKPPAA